MLLLHGVGGTRQEVAANATWLAGLGYGTLAIDFRGHGQSQRTMRTFGFLEARDARAAFGWLKRHQGGAPVAIIGISLGGAASLLGEDGPLPADALILQAVYPDIRHAIRNRIASRLGAVAGAVLEPLLSFQAPLRFGVPPPRLAPVAALARYRGPVFVIGGREDESTPPEESRAMFAAVTGTRRLWLAPFGDHAAICALADAGYRARVAAFLREALAHPVRPA